MRATGIVNQLDGQYAFVRCDRTSACSACHECASKGACHAELIFGEQKSQVTVRAKNLAGAKEGDMVELESSTIFTLSSAFLLFVMPFILSLVLYFASRNSFSQYEAFPLVLIAFFIICFIVIAKLVNKLSVKKHTIFIVTIVEESKENLEAE